MKTWNDYKEHVRTVDPEIGKDIDEVGKYFLHRKCHGGTAYFFSWT